MSPPEEAEAAHFSPTAQFGVFPAKFSPLPPPRFRIRTASNTRAAGNRKIRKLEDLGKICLTFPSAEYSEALGKFEWLAFFTGVLFDIGKSLNQT